MILHLAASLLLTATPVQDAAIPGNGRGTCPPAARISSDLPTRAIPTPPVKGVHYAGTVTVLISLSETGYVCDISVLKGIDAKLDQEAITAMRAQVFQPIQLDGKPVAGSMMIYRDFWRGDDSDFLMAENANASPDEIPAALQEPPAHELTSMVGAAKIDGNRYSNDFFGMSFTAEGAELNSPPLSDNHSTKIRLVDAVSVNSKRNDRYSLSVFADPVSKYPALKLQTQYLGILTFPFKREGAKDVRSDFPYVISGVQFMANILKQPDGPNTGHIVGVFTTVRKNYFLSLNIAASSEQQVLRIASSLHFDN